MDLILIQRDVDAVPMHLDANDSRPHERVEGITLVRSHVPRALDQPPLLNCAGSSVLKGLQNGHGIGKPVTDVTNYKGFKGNSADSLALDLA
jgi:hypothetical protein